MLSTNNVTAGIEILQNGTEAQQFTLLNFDVTDPSLFGGSDDDSDNFEVREDLNQDRTHTISAIRGDLEYEVDNNILSAVKAGARYSLLEFDALPRIRNETIMAGDPVAGPALVAACANSAFPEPNFLDGEINGNAITNIASIDDLGQPGNIIQQGTGTEFITFDDLCLAEAVLGREIEIPQAASNFESIAIDDVEEETIALYGLAEFNTELQGFPVRGNVGVRYVDTTLTSSSFRSDFDVLFNDQGEVEEIVDSGELTELVQEFSYSEFLPSLNVVVDVNDDVIVRGGIFRAISRPDPGDLGGGRDFNFISLDETEEAPTSIEEVVNDVESGGNPFLEPFTSWNFDLATEWYPNEDSILAIGGYFKVFSGGFENVSQNETFTVGGVDFVTPVSVLATTDETNTLFGVEFTASHAFTYLPGLLSGTGFKVSYNYANSNLEFEDGQFGEQTFLDDDGNVVNVIQGFIPPTNFPGLSTHTANGQVYWKIGKTTLTGIGKYRSSFFQPNNSTPQFLRTIGSAFVLDARLKHKVNKNLEVSLEGTNLLNTPREQFNPTVNNFAELNVFGPRIFAGIRAKF